MKTNLSSRKGFTLIEMLVVIAIIALLATILVPAVTGALKNARTMQTVSKARSIYLSTFTANLDTIAVGGTEEFPRQADFANSSLWFQDMMNTLEDGGNESFPQDFSIFQLPGLVAPTTIAEIDSTTNPWSVVADLSSDDPSGVPFLVSRNLNRAALIDGTGNGETFIDGVGTGTYEEPFGDQQIVYVNLGGASGKLTRKVLFWENLNPTDFTNVILNP